MTISKLARMLAMGALLASTSLVVSASAESKARIVRLSDVEGSVQIERAAGEGLEKAFLNLPIVEGSRLKTGVDGKAEVEFEDGSTLHLGSLSELAFPRLALGDGGQKLNTVQLISGTAYANFHAGKGDQLLLNFAQESLAVPGSAHFRVVLDSANHATVAVFTGSVKASGPSGDFEVAEKHAATIDLSATDSANKDAFAIAKNIESEPLDGWDRQQTAYHERYANAGGSGFSSPYGYGVSDLNYYGNFMTVPGYGFAWQPFFVDAAWSPFMDGAWAYYPGLGYTWISGYPWGWMPYYYGNWAFVPPYGWIWVPGNSWNTWYGVPRVLNPPARTRIPVAPASGRQLVLVGKGLTSNSGFVSGKLTINPGSAGYGVPRGSNHLERAAKKMEQTSAPVVVAAQPPSPQPSNGNGGFAPIPQGSRSTAPMPASHRAPAPVVRAPH